MSNEIFIGFLIFILIPPCAYVLGFFLNNIFRHFRKTP